jgi:phage terminase small subunit
MGLTPKRRAFIEYYLKCWNSSEAARLAGYKGKANVVGPRLLANVSIQAAIQARLNELQMSADEVLSRLSEMARADISDFINDFGGIDWDKVRAKGYLVKKVRHNKGKNSEIELHDAKDALIWIGKHHKLFTERHESLNVDLAQLSDEQLQRIANGEDPLAVLATSGGGGTGAAETDES